MECCGISSIVALGGFGVWKWRQSRLPMGDQVGELDAIIGTRTHARKRSTVAPRASMAARRTFMHRMSVTRECTLSQSPPGTDGTASVSFVGGRSSFQTCVSRFSVANITDAEDVAIYEEMMKEREEAKKERHEDDPKLDELRKNLAAEAADPKLARWFEYNDLLRYVRARQDLKESEVLIKKALAWRLEQEKTWNVPLEDGSFGHKYVEYEKNPLDAPDWWAFFDRNVHATLYGDDQNGVPITYVSFGQMDMSGCVREVGGDFLTQFMVYLTDHFLDRAREAYEEEIEAANEEDKDAIEPRHGGIVILDMEGLSWRHKGDISAFKGPGEVSKFLHCERQRRSFIVRAPYIFSMCWKLISPMIDARAREKMQIISASESIQPLIDELGPDLVPKCLGGTMSDLPERPVGVIKPGAFEAFKRDRERQRAERQQEPRE